VGFGNILAFYSLMDQYMTIVTPVYQFDHALN